MKNQKDILKLLAHHGMCLAFFEEKATAILLLYIWEAFWKK